MDKKEKSDFTVRVRIRFCEDNIPVYGNGISELLQCIDQLGSIRAAAKKIGMSYRKALEVIKRAEEHFGEKLLYKQTGGPDGGGSKLTGFGKTLPCNLRYTHIGKFIYFYRHITFSFFLFSRNYSYWIPAERPIIPNEYKAQISLLNKTAISESTFRYSFEIAGPAHLQIFFNPLNQSQLVSWSVCDEFPTKKFFKESTYFLTFRNGIDSNSFQFYLDFKVSFF